MVTNRTFDGLTALGDPTRRAIFDCLAERPRAVGELADALPVSRPAVSQHLKVLKDAGLVTDNANGTRRIYRLNPEGVAAMRDQLDTYWNRALEGYVRAVDQAGTGEAMTETATTLVRKEIVVDAPVERAFAVFTQQIGDFKPPEHNLLAVPIALTVFEPWVGGHIIDRGTDGSECRWASILAYDPPRRVLFSWNIGPSWQVEDDPANRSEVEVHFTSDGADRTRVELEHRHIDRHGPGWQAVHEGIEGDAGWPLYLKRYASLFTEDIP